MKILITGGCGFVGSNISVYLKKNLKNAQISSLDNFSRHGSKINFKRLKKNNIKNFHINLKDSVKLKSYQNLTLLLIVALNLQ